MRIFAFHLLNDYSGSPKVLMQLLKGWQAEGMDVNMVTCSGREGFLSNIKGVKYRYYWYSWASNPIIRLFNFVLSQMILFLSLIFTIRKTDIIYINTVLPFGAALLGKFKGCRVIYHVHETSMKPVLLKKFLFGVMNFCSSDAIYVSKYLAGQENAKNAKTYILYNAIEDSFLDIAKTNRKPDHTHGKNVLMVCSLKDYKGVYEFEALAKVHSDYNFTLVLNAAKHEIDSIFPQATLPQNLQIFPTQTNLHPFFASADVILNLSRPDDWIETFGLTIIEGMAYGLPAIVPPVGGIAELVDDGVNGYKVSSRQIEELSHKLSLILENDTLYSEMRSNALIRINNFQEQAFLKQSISILLQ